MKAGVNIKRIVFPAALGIFLAAAVYFNLFFPRPLSPCDAEPELLRQSLLLQKEEHTDWRFIYAAVADKNARDADEALKKAPSGVLNSESLLACYGEAYGKDQQEKSVLIKLELIADIAKNGGFPLSPVSGYNMEDSWGGARTYGGKRKHEGTDILCPEGTPIVAAASGMVTKLGWNELGGNRVGVTDQNGVYYYYAHLSQYADLKPGDTVARGDVIGYAGSTGYGPEGTSGKFAPHLHFGMYYEDRAFNPYPYLVFWEK